MGRSDATRAALVAGAIETLRTVGFAGASAREIARRSGCNQALVFYHFGSVDDLLLAALDDVSAQRATAYAELIERAGSLTELIDSARTVFTADLDAGHVTVLVEMITGARSSPGLGEQVAARLTPWRQLAERAVSGMLADSPAGLLVPPAEVAHAIVAGLLGLQLLATLDGDRSAALALFDRARLAAVLLDGAGGLFGGVGP